MQNCGTLRAIDDLVRFATQGARSIYTVTVLNAFFYQPDGYLTELDERCHEVLARILKAKKPKVIIRCHSGEYSVEWLKRIELPAREYRLLRREVDIAEDHTATVFQSFHPSCAVNNADCRPEYRALLISHFVAAFSELRSKFILLESAEKIRQLCLTKGERKENYIPRLKTWESAFFISKTLQEPYNGPRKGGYTLAFAGESPLESRMGQIKAYKAMYDSLKRLFGDQQSFGALGISKVIMFFWARHFRDDPFIRTDYVVAALARQWARGLVPASQLF